MAIYYIDPHTTVNGTGTWASPYSFASTTRSAWASGDELRIKGVALTSLLTATSYTATVTSSYQLTITAGGGLGADFVAGNVVYIPTYDTFFKVYASATNIVSLYTTTSILPIKDWSAVGTSITVRKVDTTTYPASAASTSYNTLGAQANITNVTISDCWTADGTRVTDGSVKTLINTSYTSTVSWYVDSSSAGGNNLTVNLQNTHVMCSTGTSTGRVTPVFNASNSTYNINQIFSWYYASGGIQIGGNGTPVFNSTISITYLCCSQVITSSYCSGVTINLTNWSNYYTDYYAFGTSGITAINAENLTINFTTILGYTTATNTFITIGACKNHTLNFNGVYDYFSPAAPTISNMYNSSAYSIGQLTCSFGAGFQFKYNKRVSTLSSATVTNRISSAATQGPQVWVPDLPLPTGWTSTNYFVCSVPTNALYSYFSMDEPTLFTFSLPSTAYDAKNVIYGSAYGNNILITYRDGSNPREILAPRGNMYFNTAVETSYPVVTKDATVYRSSGPSLKSYLSTRVTAMWAGDLTNIIGARAYKAIKIPVTSGVSCTVSGYIRTDETSFTNGDCRVRIYLGETQVATQDMTTACKNAWEHFTLTFTPSFTGEAIFSWEMWYLNGAKSYWLDDLTVT